MFKRFQTIRLQVIIPITLLLALGVVLLSVLIVLDRHLTGHPEILRHAELHQPFIQQVVLWVAVPLLFVFSLLIFLAHKLVYQPLQAITQRAMQTASGGALPDQPLPLPHAEELRQITHAFNAMTERLRSEQQNLEARIAERTERLQTLTQELEQQVEEHEEALCALQESEQRYRLLFDDSPIPIMEEDLSGVAQVVRQLQAEGISDLRAHLQTHPEDAARALQSVRVIEANKAALQLYDCQSAAELDRQFAAFVGAGNANLLVEDMITIAAGETRHEEWKVNYNRQGEPIYIHLIWQELPNTQQPYQRVIVTLMDITERKRAEDALRQSEERYRSLFDDSPVAMTEEDYSATKAMLEDLKAQGVDDIAAHLRANPHILRQLHAAVRLVDANRAALQLYGYDSLEEMQRAFMEYTAGGMHEGTIVSMAALARGAIRHEMQKVNYTRQGEERIIQLIWKVAPGYEQTYGKVINTILDITERKRAEDALRVSEQRFRTLFEQSPVPMSEEDFSAAKAMFEDLKAQGISDLRAHLHAHPQLMQQIHCAIRVLDVNRAALQLYGYADLEDMRRGFTHYTASADDQTIADGLIAIGEGKLRYEGERVNYTQDGRMLFIRLIWQVAPGSEQTYDRVIVTALDITQHRQAELALQESERRYRSLFEDSPVALMEQDHSQAFAILKRLQAEGVEDIAAYMRQHPDEMQTAYTSLRLISANKAALQLYACETLAELQEIFTHSIGDVMQEPNLTTLTTMAEGKPYCELEKVNYNRRGEPFDVRLLWRVAPGCENDYRKVLYTIIDVTEQRRTERLRDLQRDLAISLRRASGLHASLQALLDILIQLQEFDSGGIYLVDPIGGGLELAAHHGLSEGFVQRVARYEGGSLHSQLVRRGEMMYHPAEEFPAPIFDDLREEGIRTLAVIPIAYGGRVIALLNLASHTRQRITANERKLAEAIAESQLGGLIAQIVAEETLRQSEERYRLLFNTESDAIFLIDNESGLILDANLAAEALYGYTRRELLQLRNVDLSAQPDETRRATLTGLTSIPVRYHRKKDGTVFPVEITASHLTLRGRPVHIAAIRDITARMQTEEALRENEARLRAFMDNAPSLVLIKDHESRPIYVNQAFRQMFPAEDWLGKSPHETFPPETAEEMLAKDRQALEEGFIQYEETWKALDGKEYIFETRKFRIERPGAPPLIGATITDITERKHAEEALRRTSEELEGFFNAALDLLAILTVDGIFLRLNREWERVLGWRLDELIGHQDLEFLHPDDLEETLKVIEVMQREGELRGFVNRYRHKDGSYRWLSWHSHQIGERIYAAAMDITEQRATLEALREKNEEIERFFASSLYLLCIADTDGYFRKLNREWERVLGYPLNELEGKRFVDFVHPDDLPATLEAVAALDQQSEIPSFINRYRCKDGSYRWLEWRSFPHGKSIYAAARDITEQKRTLEALAESEQRYRTLYETMVQGVLYGDGEGRILSANPAALRILGLTQEEMSTHTMTDPRWRAIHEDGSPFAPEEHPSALALRSGSPVLGVTMGVFNPREGAYRWVLIDAIPLFRPDEERPHQVYATLTDITERKQLQEAMLANEKMAALGTLAAGIAHEINSPLQIITGTSENLIRQISAGNLPDAARLQAKLENVHRSAWSVAEIVRSLLAYAHPSSQKFDTHDLNHIVHDTLLLIEHQLRSWSSVFVLTELTPDLPDLYCDRNQISQALINLLTNARDAMPGGGQIVIRTRFDGEHRRVALEVSDQGSGIPPAMQKRIFDPFFTTKEVGKGTGLGLSIVAGIVRLHGGEIEVHSQEGMGSTFTLWFPLERPSEEENPSEIGRY
ncbi:MAG: PAS domain S-box protein [Anaerolineae bacterium]|nr:PAS domain S-box protein [Anaerolineae bacterium]